MQFFIPKTEAIFKEEIKKSQFITYIRHTEGMKQAKAFWAEIRTLHPNARHHCWASIAGAPNDSQQYGFSDDGEPSGTAGKPMLNYLLGSQLGEVSAVVVRYSGGILLGTGGLVRAYGNGVHQALALIEKTCKILRKSYRLQCDYHQFHSLQHLIAHWDIEILEQQFGEGVHLVIGINPTELSKIEQEITERFNGKLILQAVE
ncbi:YigZ family protein [Vespertiliibacter pulmonis]|uniref:Putative YigZ family protein n=1 Tax=Vespertiliibacter pulmonis TaxID=1443036 RepID=A0A3N4VIV1_9PAST|nr:YigZ family protein [Vespertiliibacter pulmonis]QLB20625.1 YigZ family protein [Vespertiliibacter pulmonis]RPE82758.1 putative YigZ family protein [Vespertiliibacter pulmonis]